MFKKSIPVDFPIFKAVEDGVMSTPNIGEGRFIPSVIIDIEENIEIGELLKLHENTPPGDTELQWHLPSTFFGNPKSVLLKITFIKPMSITFGIEFSISEREAAIDGIIQSRGVHLQIGKSGDKVSTIFVNEAKQKTHGCVLVEVPNLDFDTKWNELHMNFLKHKYRKQGASKSDSNTLAKEQIKKMRELWNVRRPID